MSYNVQNEGRSLCNDGRSLVNKAGDLRGAVSPPARPGHNPGGAAGGEAPVSSENLAFYNTGKDA